MLLVLVLLCWDIVSVAVKGQGQETLADLTGASSCGVPGDRSGRSSAHSGGT